MSLITAHVRHGIGAVRPYIHGPFGLPEFVVRTFHAVELERHAFTPESAHVELRIGDSVLVIEAGKLPPEVEAWTSVVYVYVDDVDAVLARALQMGAALVSGAAAKPYHERQAAFTDSGDNTWYISTYKP